jgi:hypothetical protein
MGTLSIQTATLFVSYANLTDIPKRMFTLTNQCPMSTLKAQPNGCRNEAYQKKYANNTKSTEMEMSYASIISTVLESLRAAK